MYDLSDYDYQLPEELIAQTPAAKRDRSQLLLLDRNSGNIQKKYFANIIDHFNQNDVLVLNNTKVDPVRLYGFKDDSTKKKVEVFVLKLLSDGSHEVLMKPAKKFPIGTKINFATDFTAIVEEVIEASGHRAVRFSKKGNDFYKALSEYGTMPLPPYIKVPETRVNDRYQTVFAKHSGAVAAPTAGLHFTPELLANIADKGVSIQEITLHTGIGTFSPIRVTDIRDHTMHHEYYDIEPSVWQKILKAKQSGKRIVCVGTTSVRTLEAAMSTGSLSGETNIFIYPGYKFELVDAMITNFHLPKSSLMLLVSAFAGRENIMEAYQYAIGNKFRFFSFGDAMFIS